MPTRILREGILTSERVNELPPEGELFYRRLMSVVDDFGRFSANHTLLRSAAYPLKPDLYNEERIAEFLGQCEAARLLQVYEVAGKRYLEMIDFRQRTRANTSKCPEPPGGCPSNDGHVSDTRAQPPSNADIRASARSESESDTDTYTSNRGEAMFLTEENTSEAKQAIGAHRGRGDEPDTTITRKILVKFEGMGQFQKWVTGLSAGVDPKEIRGDGFAFYLADAQRWIENGGRRPPKRKARTLPSQGNGPHGPERARRIGGKSLHPRRRTHGSRTRRRLEAAAAKPSPYFDTTIITGKQENNGNA